MCSNRNDEDEASSELELSSLSSSDSFEPRAFEGPPSEFKSIASESSAQPSPSIDTKDFHPVKSNGTLRKQDSNVIEQIMTHNATEGRSETVESLKKNGLDLKKKAIPDINNPAANYKNCAFPEEYQMETDTGLVKAQTLHGLNRLESRNSGRSGASQKKSIRTGNSTTNSDSASASNTINGLDGEKLRKAVEKNQKKIDKYQRHKASGGLRKFIGKIFD
ncbi:LAQU0S04e02718g1_1 [Lachancea quebecensis]|uniref:LAQU0S04e02718g1_1 n=1 Tax=Lachancea quebecensis TaxID=1654605 RepID=A0A0P1KZF2_9SACH|nr:LAQU0S04e02718g1_1 [Lachancea quebecensis]